MKNGKKSLIGILLLTLFLVNMTAPASAYVYNGAYWYNGIAPVQERYINSKFLVNYSNCSCGYME
jgi:hypothetical protein